MTITKQKECDQCDTVSVLEPFHIGNEPYNWIEICMVSWGTESMFQGTMHFCSDKCLIEYVKSKKAFGNGGKSHDVVVSWRVEYQNDEGPNGEGFWQWWEVTNGDKCFKCNDEIAANWLCDLLNKVS